MHIQQTMRKPVRPKNGVIAIWNEHGMHEHGIPITMESYTNITYNGDSKYDDSKYIYVKNMPKEQTHVTCILQINNWKAMPISSRAQG